MTPVKQTKFHTEAQNGNCMAAALASLLDLDIAEVPAFEDLQETWKRTLLAWIDSLGMTIRVQDHAPEGFAIATGPSNRGIHHAVIVNNGAFAHDPHPSNDFLVAIKKYWAVTPKAEQQD